MTPPPPPVELAPTTKVAPTAKVVPSKAPNATLPTNVAAGKVAVRKDVPKQAAAPPKSSVKRALPGTAPKKTKRHKKKDEKSTTTTTTARANIPINVYDAVLGEAEDLMAAAMEAQALGRLKMASAYQLLLHARLVGLGKRFDRAQTVDSTPETTSTSTTSPASAATTSKDSPVSTKSVGVPKTATPDSKEQAPPSVQELAKLIPKNVELDSAMMEHLARAAMELHHKRTGRRIQSDIASPPPAKTTPAPATTGVAWTEQELTKFKTTIAKGVSDPAEIAKAVGTRTEAQVKAYLRNTKERQKGAQAVEQEWQQHQEVKDGDKEEPSPRKRGGRGRKPPTQAMNTVPNAKLDARSLLSGKAKL